MKSNRYGWLKKNYPENIKNPGCPGDYKDLPDPDKDACHGSPNKCTVGDCISCWDQELPKEES